MRASPAKHAMPMHCHAHACMHACMRTPPTQTCSVTVAKKAPPTNMKVNSATWIKLS